MLTLYFLRFELFIISTGKKEKFSKFKKYNGHSSHVTLVRWAVDDSKLISIGGNDTSIIIWNNQSYECTDIHDTSGANKLERSKSISTDMVLRNSRKGESDDSETDSEDEGYDSDVKREHAIDYNKNIFVNEIKRPSAEVVQKMYQKVTVSNKQ